MKLVFWGGTGGDRIPVKIVGTSIGTVNWCELEAVRQKEDYHQRKWFFGLLKMRYFRPPISTSQMFTPFTSLCVPEDGFVYAILNPAWGVHSFDNLRKSLDLAGLRSLKLSKKTLIAELHQEHIPMVFAEGSWQISQHFILTARKAIDNWLELLKEAHDSEGFDYKFLVQLEAIICNSWEHGIDATSSVKSIEDLKDIASWVSSELNVPFEFGHPYGAETNPIR